MRCELLNASRSVSIPIQQLGEGGGHAYGLAFVIELRRLNLMVSSLLPTFYDAL